MKRTAILFIVIFSLPAISRAQKADVPPPLTHADTLLGSINPERAFNVLRYDISITPDYDARSITGKNTITYLDSGLVFMQIDLQEPLTIDSIIYRNRSLSFKQEGNAWLAYVGDSLNTAKRSLPGIQKLTVYYHGHPKIAAKPPWVGGWVFAKDSLGRPWMSVACEEAGASVWYPCKDYLGDEPDSGAGLSITVADSLVAVGNGRLMEKIKNGDGTSTWIWTVKSPINNYDIIPCIGKYTTWHSVFDGEKGKLDCDFWVLDYHVAKAKKHFSIVDSMLTCFEYWFGPYPFYEDGYKLVEAPYLGMEHQSNIAYGNHYLQGYAGRDLSGTGWGLKWDFIIVHESGHEWFGNSISAKDIADEWIHEAFTNYSETLYTAYYFGREAGDAYVIGLRKNIQNKYPIIQYYGVHRAPVDTDEYYKGSNMIHTIRQVINNDSLFRKILRGLNRTFYHQIVTANDIEQYFNQESGKNFTPVFNQYLRSSAVPVLEYKITGNELRYRWTHCNADFDMAVKVHIQGTRWLQATNQWQKTRLNTKGRKQFSIDPNFYVGIKNLNSTEPIP